MGLEMGLVPPLQDPPKTEILYLLHCLLWILRRNDAFFKCNRFSYNFLPKEEIEVEADIAGDIAAS